jgi:hypothetical protein
MNQEIWIYQFTVADTANLPVARDVGFCGSAERHVFTPDHLNTPASRAPSPGGTLSNGIRFPPFIADDNRDATISDNGSVIAFTSTRDLVPGSNQDPTAIDKQGNPEIFIANIATRLRRSSPR